jgi:cyclophilin family peptidyl-prolyl cis-trans isomerase
MFLFLVLRSAISEPTVTHKVFFDIEKDSIPVGRVVLGLYGEIAPKTVENFVHHIMCDIRNDTTGVLKCYKGSKFHRLIPGLLAQAGDYVNGTGGFSQSIWGGSFEDETFEIELKGPGILAMANGGPNANGCQFFITVKPAPRLEGKHVAFGRVMSGLSVVDRIAQCGSKRGRPTNSVVIVDCGVF